jgi:hypothetical protein
MGPRSKKYKILVPPRKVDETHEAFKKRIGSEWANNTERIYGSGEMYPYNGGPYMAGITKTSFPVDNSLYHSPAWENKQSKLKKNITRKFIQNWSEGKLYPIAKSGKFNDSKHPYTGPIKTIPYDTKNGMNSLKLPIGYDIKFIHDIPDYDVKFFDELPDDMKYVFYKKTRKNRKTRRRNRK